MSTFGFIENRIRPTPSPSTDYYLTLFNFLSSSGAQGNGIQLIAYNTGTNGTGGMNYSDERNRVGDNSLALFKFSLASPPFYVLLQFATGSNPATGNPFGIATGASVGLTASIYGNATNAAGTDVTNAAVAGFPASHGAVAIAVACLDNGGNPWNGTTNANGRDTKGNPVWVSGSDLRSLCTWPRSNGQTGSFDVTSSAFNPAIHTRRHNMIPLVTHFSMSAKHTSVSVLADHTNLLISTDVNNTGNSTFFYFGKYNARPGLVPQVPYVCLATTGSGLNPPFSIRPQRFGTLNGLPEEGGVAHPVASFGVRACSLDYLRTFVTTQQLHPNTMFKFPHKFDQFVYFLLLDEDPNQYGYLGTIDFFRLVFGTVPRAVSRTRNFAIFGGTNPAAAKLLIPWDGASPAGSGGNRRGKVF